MRKVFAIVFIISFMAVGTASGVSKVPARYNGMSFYTGSSVPVGQYDQFADIEIITDAPSGKVPAGDTFESSFHLGLSYGTLRNDRVYYSLGLNYTKVDLAPWLAEAYVTKVNVGIFDVDFNLDYFFNNPAKAPFTPFAGIGFHGGLLTISAKGYDSDNHLKLGISGRFGAEMKISENIEKGTSWSIVSNNWYTFAASDGRPKYVNFGIGIKYYFRP